MTTIEERTLGALPALTAHAELALLARALHRGGWDDGHLGHITYRQPDETLLTLPKELGWNEVSAADILRIDLAGRKLEGQGTVPVPITLHIEYHLARPGAGVTVHQHPRFATVWSACGRIPPIYDQRSAFVGDDEIVLWDDNIGSVENEDAAKAAVAAMGDASIALLRNHGVMVVADTIAQAYNKASSFEWRCKRAWMVEAIGGDRTLPPVARDSIRASIRSIDGVIPGLWEWAARGEMRADATVTE